MAVPVRFGQIIVKLQRACRGRLTLQEGFFRR